MTQARRQQALARRSACACLFWSKVFLAILLALSGIAFQSYLIYDARRSFVKKTPVVVPLIRIPSAYDSNASLCYFTQGAGNSRPARLEPPRDSFLWGFHLQWDVDDPERLVRRLNGRKPAIIKYVLLPEILATRLCAKQYSHTGPTAPLRI